VRALALLLLVSTAAFADEIDLSQRRSRVPTWVVRAEAGNEFAPFGMAGGAISYLTESQFEFEAGLGAGFPGLQLGLATRWVFGEDGSFLVTELALAGNTRVDRGPTNGTVTTGNSSLWTDFGLGFEQRTDLFDLSLTGSIVFTTANFTPRWSIHGGLGFGF
jgi:hypothetical protein